MATLMIVHRVGSRAEVLLNRDHIVFATRNTTQQGAYTEVVLAHAGPGSSPTLSITEDLGELLLGRIPPP